MSLTRTVLSTSFSNGPNTSNDLNYQLSKNKALSNECKLKKSLQEEENVWILRENFRATTDQPLSAFCPTASQIPTNPGCLKKKQSEQSKMKCLPSKKLLLQDQNQPNSNPTKLTNKCVRYAAINSTSQEKQILTPENFRAKSALTQSKNSQIQSILRPSTLNLSKCKELEDFDFFNEHESDEEELWIRQSDHLSLSDSSSASNAGCDIHSNSTSSSSSFTSASPHATRLNPITHRKTRYDTKNVRFSIEKEDKNLTKPENSKVAEINNSDAGKTLQAKRVTDLSNLDLNNQSSKKTMKKLKMPVLNAEAESGKKATIIHSVVRSLSASSTSTFKPKQSKKVDFNDNRNSMSYDLRSFQIETSSSLTSGSFSPSTSSSQSSPKSASLTESISKSNPADSSFTETSSSQSKTTGSSSSTSSGVSSNNISSASSTTSETPSANEQNNVILNRELMKSVNVKKAPKAVISDDGDIEVEKGTEPSTPSRTVLRATPSHHSKDQRLSVRLLPATANNNNNNNARAGSERASQRLTETQNYSYFQPANQIQASNKAFQVLSQQQQLQNQQQSQLAAAAAAAAAMDKEKQRDALIEYVKSQQLKQLRLGDKQFKPPEYYTQQHSFTNVLPRKQMFVKSEKSNETKKCFADLGATEFRHGVENNEHRTLSSRAAPNQPASSCFSINRAPTANPVVQHVVKTPVKRDTSLGICYLMFGPETKRTLLPSQVTGIDTVKALFVRTFPEKLTMNFLDNEKTVKIYIKDQLKELFYQLEDMSDIKDRCVLKLIELGQSASTEATKEESNKSPIYSQPFVQPSFTRHQEPTNTKAPKPSLNETYSCPLPAQPSQFRFANNQKVQSPTASTATLVEANHYSSIAPTINNANNHNQANVYHRSLSEPRHNPLPRTCYQDNYHYKPSQPSNCIVETYDNLSEQLGSHARSSYGENGRDAKSMDREMVGGHVARKMNASKQQQQQLQQRASSEVRSCAEMEIRSGSQTPRLSIDDEDDATTVSQTSYGTLKSSAADAKKCDEHEMIDSLDENDIDNFETSKIKMKLMQKQLQTLTNLVHQALINRDLNQLAAQYSVQSVQSQALDQAWQKVGEGAGLRPRKEAVKAGRLTCGLKELSCKAGQLKNELGAVRKLQESFSASFADSMKTFASQLNDKVRSFCLGEINEKIKLDMALFKYQSGTAKIENELSDLETVVEDLRENVLKHKCQVSVDDVECYALALSQLSKQLVGLKGAFAGLKDQLKPNARQSAEPRLLSVESARLDLIIRRCKRVTGILIILKKLATNPRENKPFDQETPLSSLTLTKELLREMESAQPDNEQRQLAIEVDKAFSQLMSEISSIAQEINASSARSSRTSPHSPPYETEDMLKKRAKSTPTKNSPNNNNNQTQSNVVLLKPIIMDRSYLETVHEEDLSGASVADESSSTSSLSSSTNTQCSSSTSQTSLTSCKQPNNNIDELQLYEQLSQLKPLKPAKSFKASTSICVNVKEITPQPVSNEHLNSLVIGGPSNVMTSSMTITPSTTIIENAAEANLATGTVLRRPSQKGSDEVYSTSKQLNVVTNGKMSVRFSDAPTSIIPHVNWTMTTNESRSFSSSSSNSGSSGYSSDANHSGEDTTMSSSDSSETVLCGGGSGLNAYSEINNEAKAYTPMFNGSYLMTNGKSSIVIPRRSSSLLASSTSTSNAPRRVSLSVTDL